MTITKKIFLLLITFAIVALAESCECVVKPPCNGAFNFKVIDKVSHKDLVFGAGARYSSDSIKMINTNDTIPQSFVDHSQNRLDCYISGSGDTLYLKLNETDVDTLLLSFRTGRHTLCCPSGQRNVTGIRINNVAAKQDSSVFIFEK